MSVADTGPRTDAAPAAPPDLPKDLTANPTLARWLTVAADGTIGLRVGKVELGQGILTALAQIAADELDVPLAQVRMLPAHTGCGPDEGLTAGSMSIVEAGPAVRLACAHARALFVAEAARRWGVDPGTVRVVAGADHPLVVKRLDAGVAQTPDDGFAFGLVLPAITDKCLHRPLARVGMQANMLVWGGVEFGCNEGAMPRQAGTGNPGADG